MKIILSLFLAFIVSCANADAILTSSASPYTADSSATLGSVLTGTGTFTVPSGVTRFKVTIIGGGGGGAGSGTGGGAGGNGTASTFDTFIANGGSGSTTTATIGGAGGTVTGTPSIAISGQYGSVDSGGTTNGESGHGGNAGIYGLGGAPQMVGSVAAALPGTGYGGGGAGGNPVTTVLGAPGGGGGGTAVNYYVNVPAGSTYSYSVGTGGAGGTLGTGGAAGAAGAPGVIIVEY